MTAKNYKVLRAAQCLGATVLVAGIVGSVISIAAAQQGSGVTVTRGVEIDKDTGILTDDRKRVTVFRGQPTFTTQDLSSAATTSAPGIDPVQGFDGWFLDRANNRLVNCYRIDGTQVGQRRIRCIAKRL